MPRTHPPACQHCTLPSWQDPNRDVTPADPDTIRAIRARKDRP